MKGTDAILLALGGLVLYEFFIKPPAAITVTRPATGLPLTSTGGSSTTSLVTTLLTNLGTLVSKSSAPVSSDGVTFTPAPDNSQSASQPLTSYYAGVGDQSTMVLPNGVDVTSGSGLSQGLMLPSTLAAPSASSAPSTDASSVDDSSLFSADNGG